VLVSDPMSADSINRPVLAASCACFRAGKLLLAQRANPPQYWTLPGGRVEFGEDAASAAVRELREETGVEAEVLGFAGFREVISRRGGNLHFVVLAFAARWVAGEAAASAEAAAVEWIDPAELGRFKTTEGLAEIVENARRIVGG
jgi:8-oxo-dGTP diphosphatase